MTQYAVAPIATLSRVLI